MLKKSISLKENFKYYYVEKEYGECNNSLFISIIKCLRDEIRFFVLLILFLLGFKFEKVGDLYMDLCYEWFDDSDGNVWYL